MKKKFLIGLCLVWLLSFACSKSPEGEVADEKGVIKEMTDRAADEIVQHIRTPINKARSAKDLEDGRVEEMENNLKALDE